MPVIYGLGFWLYYERIILAEESFLTKKFGEIYTTWADTTPAFWPRISGWISSDAPFALKRTIRREHNGLAAMLLFYFLIEQYRNHAVNQELRRDDFWLILMLIGMGIFLIVEVLLKLGFFKSSKRQPS